MSGSDSKKKIDAQVRKEVARYEDMLMSGRKEYFDEDDLLDVADYYYNDMSRGDDALKCLDYAIRLHPSSMLALLMKAEVLYFGGDREQAWKILDGIKDKSDPDVMYYFGLFNLEEGSYKEAEMCYQRAYFGQVGDSVDMFCQIVWDYLDRNLTAGLDKWFALLPDTLKDEKEVLEAKAEFLRQKGEFAEAISIEEKLLDSDPYNITYWNSLAKLYCQTRNLDKAMECVTYALDINPSEPESMLIGGEISGLRGDYEQAGKFYGKYLETNDKDAVAYFNNSQVLTYQEKYEEALVQLEYAQKYSHDGKVSNLELYEQFSTLYWALDSMSMSRFYLEKAKKEGLSDELYYMRMLSIELKAGRKGRVAECVKILLDNAIKKHRDPGAVLLMLMSFGRFSLLKKAADVVREKIPEYADHCSPFLAFVAMHEQKWSVFFRNLKTAVERAPEITYHVFSGVFPETLDVRDYYDYAVQNMGGRK